MVVIAFYEHLSNSKVRDGGERLEVGRMVGSCCASVAMKRNRFHLVVWH